MVYEYERETMRMYSVGKLARICDLSRTTLLYYDSIGLLRPSARSGAGYRLYTEDDRKRLEQINVFREMGVPLEEIKNLLSVNEPGVTSLLLKRLGELNQEIETLRKRQERILQFLRKTQFLLHAWKSKSREELEAIFDGAGITEQTAQQWHANFEKASPEEHRQFLALLGFSAAEQEEIAQLAREV